MTAKLPGDYAVTQQQLKEASRRLSRQATLSTGPEDALVLTDHEIRKRAEWEPGSVHPAAEIVPTAPNNLPAGAVPEYRFHPKRQFKMDFAWPEHKVYLEINGGIYGRGKKCPVCGRRAVGAHTSIERLKSDMEKINLASAMGWRPVLVTPQQFSSGEAARLVRAAMEGTR